VTRKVGGAVAIPLLAVSHWVLDFAVHVKDLPLYPGSPLYGLGLWRATDVTVMVEMVMFLVGLVIYLRTTRATSWVGRWALAALVLTLVAIYTMNVTSPPPQDMHALALFGLVGWLVPFWAAWADSRREPVPTSVMDRRTPLPVA
jgi:hypothetical protein